MQQSTACLKAARQQLWPGWRQAGGQWPTAAEKQIWRRGVPEAADVDGAGAAAQRLRHGEGAGQEEQGGGQGSAHPGEQQRREKAQGLSIQAPAAVSHSSS